MPKPPRKSDNSCQRSPTATFALVGAGFLAYWTLYFLQPSIFGFTDAGTTVNRFVDVMQLFLLEQLFSSLTGNGRFEVGLLDRLPVLLGGLLWLGMAWTLGTRLLARVTFAENLSPLERHATGTLLGLTLLSTLTLLLGLAGQLTSRWPLVALLLLLVLCAAADWWKGQQRKPLQNAATDSPALASVPQSVFALWLSRLIAPFTCGLALAYVLGSCLPPWEFDVLEYHLQAPKECWQAGRIEFNSHNVYANMPLGTEMHSLAAMVLVGGDAGWWWGGLIGKTITGCLTLIAAALVGGFVGRQFGRWCGWIAGGLLLSTPGVAHVSMAGLIDMALASYLLAALIVLTTAWRSLASGHGNGWDLFTISLLAGAGAACKYTGLLYVTLPIMAACGYALVRARSHKALSLGLIAGLAGLCLTCIPWYAKNYWQCGNPFYPLAAGLFPCEGLSDAQIQQWQAAHRVPLTAQGHSAYSLLALGASLKQVLLASHFLAPSLVGLMLCGVFAGWPQRGSSVRRWPIAWLLFAIWILAVWWGATHRIDRFWLPVVPIWCGLAGLGAHWIARNFSVGIASIIVIVNLVFGGFMSISGVFADNRFFVSLAELRQDVGDEEHAGRLSPVIGWINSTRLAADTRILLIGEARAFDFEPPIVYATCFNTNPGEAWLRGKSVDQQKSALAHAGITHILVNWVEIARYRSPGNYGFSDWPQRDDIESLIRSRVLQSCDSPFDDADLQILEVVDREQP